jgi:fibronectin type 3 domain-containing protein
VSWSEAPAWGTGAGGSYAIYRDTTPGFTPGPGNLVASGIGGTSWTDPAPPAGISVHYLVRAESDETCGTGPANGGLTDGNLVHVTAVNETSQSAPGDVGNTLSLDTVNAAHVRLEWTSAANAAGYRVYRSSTPGSGVTQIGAPQGTLFEDDGALAVGGIAYYGVVATDACGNESAD